MARPPKWVSEENALIGWGPLRRSLAGDQPDDREAKAIQRTERKARDKKRRKCKCEAYPWPHRPGGDRCRWPDPPLERYQRKNTSRYRKRYAGLLRQVARANGLHPIRDRATIDALMPGVLLLARQVKAKLPRVKYRNIKITKDHREGISAQWQTAGPRCKMHQISPGIRSVIVRAGSCRWSVHYFRRPGSVSGATQRNSGAILPPPRRTRGFC